MTDFVCRSLICLSQDVFVSEVEDSRQKTPLAEVDAEQIITSSLSCPTPNNVGLNASSQRLLIVTTFPARRYRLTL
jgi:hypothetical protein